MEEKKQIELALAGDRKALESLIVSIQDKIYNLALRFLWHPEDARDATQEILIRIITNLSRFEGRSAFATWCYRIASNYLLAARKSKVEAVTSLFADFGVDLREGLDRADYMAADRDVLTEEVKTGCTLGMLLCLSRELRLAFILDNVFELTSNEGSMVLTISPEAYRKRVSRAYESLQHFMRGHCGLINPANARRCSKRIPSALAKGRINASQLLFANAATDYNGEMEKLHTVAGLYKTHMHYQVPVSVTAEIKNLLESNYYRVLE